MRQVILAALVAAIFVMAVPVAAQIPDKAGQAQALKEQGDSLSRAKKWADAITVYKQAIALDPNSAPLHHALGEAYYKEKMFVDAAAEYTEAAALNPGNVDELYNVATAYRKAGRHNEAIKYYDKFLKSRPEDVDAFFGMAECYKTLGEREKAIENYNVCIQKEAPAPQKKWTEKSRAAIAELGGSEAPASNPAAQPGAVAASSAAVAAGVSIIPGVAASASAPAAAPAPAPAWQPPPAAASPAPVAVAPVAVETPSPGAVSSDPLISEADAHFKAGSYHNAVLTYRDAVVRNPNSVEAHYKLGLAYAVLKRYEPALAEWHRVLELDPSNQGARDNIAKAEAKLGIAPQPVSAAVPPPPPAPPAKGADELYQAAVAANAKADYAKAVTLCDQALAIKQDFAKAYVTRGEAQLGLGNTDEAIKSFNSARVFDPTLGSPLFGLAEAYRLLADKDKALHYYKLYLKSPGPDNEKWRLDRAAKMVQIMEPPPPAPVVQPLPPPPQYPQQGPQPQPYPQQMQPAYPQQGQPAYPQQGQQQYPQPVQQGYPQQAQQPYPAQQYPGQYQQAPVQAQPQRQTPQPPPQQYPQQYQQYPQQQYPQQYPAQQYQQTPVQGQPPPQQYPPVQQQYPQYPVQGQPPVQQYPMQGQPPVQQAVPVQGK